MQSYSYLDDSSLRDRALNPGESFIIQAPAGSGKTELLTNRILSLLSVVSRPEEILAITFTKKAILEMRTRVINKLKLGLCDIPPSDVVDIISWKLSRLVLERDSLLGWDLLKYPDRINIKTFDSLCFGLVSSLPLLSEISSIPSIAKDPIKYYKAAAYSTLNLAGDYQCVRSLLSHLDIDIKSAIDCIVYMLSKRDQWASILKYGFSRDLFQKELHSAIEKDMTHLLSLMPANWMEDLKQPIIMASRILYDDNKDSILENLLNWNGCLSPGINNLKKIKALASIFLTSQDTLRSPKGLSKKNGFPPGSPHKKKFSEWLMTVKDSHDWVVYLVMLRYAPDDITENQWNVLSDHLNVLLLSVANLSLQFRQRGEIDFIEIAQRAVAVLGNEDNPSDLLLKIDYAISHILVDEFQDTSHIHFELLKVIMSGWQNDCGKSVFIVGDPMQSIYRFRGSDVGLFLNVIKYGIGEIKPFFLKLVSNFRSQSNLVKWTNGVFSSLFPYSNDENIGAISYSPSVSVKPIIDGSAVTFHPLFIKNKIVDNELEELSLNVIGQVLEKSSLSNLESTAMLVQSRNNLGNMINILSKNKIPFRAVEITSLSEKTIVSDLMQIIRAIVHPGDRLAWLSVLRSPFCGLKLETLHMIFGSDHKTPVPVILRKILDSHCSTPNDPNGNVRFFLSGEDSQESLSTLEYRRLVNIAHVLLHSNYSGSFPFSSWIRYLWDLLGGSSVYSDPDADNDAESIFCLIDEIASYGNIDIDVLENEISNLLITSDNTKIGEPFIEIMTIHKAKGLQFDNVILYGIHNSSIRNLESIMRFESHFGNVLFAPMKSKVNDDHDPMIKYIRHRDKVRDSYELDRLIYVAVTRAKKKIHIISPVLIKDDKVTAPNKDSLLNRLWKHLLIPDIKYGAVYEKNKSNDNIISRVLYNDIIPDKKIVFNSTSELTSSYFFGSDYNHSYIINRLILDWLAQIGKTGIDNYSEGFYRYLPIVKKQLLRKSFFGDNIEESAILIVNLIENFLKDDMGMWILSHKKSYRDIAFVDGEGLFFRADVILELENRLLLVEYNLSMVSKNESIEDFVKRIVFSCRDKLSNCCDAISLTYGKPSTAAVCFPFYCILVYI
ncbi:nuclease/helicase [Candidatus Kinetoplastibacterium blastocrithidii TCC012E]|uniref:DNA 3'-5' helicase n=1 Tax=Candidatus Kinetoplastidibacterium blastocrithidiae TCC012E TaxID=1208922 RepID=M1LAS6_9PROT|nr:UvrD-helicase domain-containing protein [Candidatus Kinetoplastibacterium blastocrithidii]AGF49583.1 nuclease/helicase [Candidatus Kinetoplastibacterium blastocrithidii TCC012E]